MRFSSEKATVKFVQNNNKKKLKSGCAWSKGRFVYVLFSKSHFLLYYCAIIMSAGLLK